jgi:hypothetical protein
MVKGGMTVVERGRKLWTKEAKGKKHKLSARDIRHAKLMIGAASSKDMPINLTQMAETINSTKSGTNQVDKSTIARHLAKGGIKCDMSAGNIPRELKPEALSSWLSRRRSLALKLKKGLYKHVVMADEAYFGFKQKVHVRQRQWHLQGRKRIVQREKQGTEHRVTVYGAMGLDHCPPLVVFKAGTQLDGETYRRMLDSKILPPLARFNPPVKFYDDRYSCHVQVDTEDLFEDNDIEHRSLVEYGCDLNWMEKVWANMNEIIYEHNTRTFSSKESLEEAVQKAWAKTAGSKKFRAALLERYREACKKVVDAQGYRVHWD